MLVLAMSRSGSGTENQGKEIAGVRSRMLRIVSLGAACSLALVAAPASTQLTLATLLPVQVEAAQGRILFTLPAPDRQGVAGRFLYANSLRTGLGSADLRLDRGMVGPEHILAFRRIGRKIAVIFENHRFRATGDQGVQDGGRDSFPFTTVAMLDIVSTNPDGGLVVDMAPFLTRDLVGIAETLNEEGKGFKLVDSLSAADPTSVKMFPDNIEIDAVQTYQSDNPGQQVRQIAVDPHQVSFIVHHSFIRLPEPVSRSVSTTSDRRRAATSSSTTAPRSARMSRNKLPTISASRSSTPPRHGPRSGSRSSSTSIAPRQSRSGPR